MARVAGDWDCPKCGNNNFRTRDECRRCPTKRPATAIAAAAGHIEIRPGDWRCTKCNKNNFKNNSICFGCRAAKPAPAETDRERDRPAPAGATRKPGDWDCPKCTVFNFANRMRCMTCREPNPDPRVAEAAADSKIDDENLCRVCQDNARAYMIEPCCHYCLCVDCKDDVKETGTCPICRGDITTIKKIY